MCSVAVVWIMSKLTKNNKGLYLLLYLRSYLCSIFDAGQKQKVRLFGGSEAELLGSLSPAS